MSWGILPEKNNFSNQDEAFYDWKVVEETELATGVVLKHFSFTNFSQNIYALEIDLTNPKVTFETVMADDLPQSQCQQQLKQREEPEGDPLEQQREGGARAGILWLASIPASSTRMTDFRGMHIEEGEPVFVNNPDVRESLVNHRPDSPSSKTAPSVSSTDTSGKPESGWCGV